MKKKLLVLAPLMALVLTGCFGRTPTNKKKKSSSTTTAQTSTSGGQSTTSGGTSGTSGGTSGTSATTSTSEVPAKTLSSIAVATAPTKVTYVAGEYFDPTGLVITRTYSDSTHDTYTYAGHASEFTFTPSTSTALQTTDVEVTITYSTKSCKQAITVNAPKVLSTIAVATAPTKVTYTEGEHFNPAGLVITRNYSDSTHDTYTYADHTSEFSFAPALTTALTTTDVKVTITYGGKSCEQAITVNESTKTLDSIAVKTAPTKVAYNSGDFFDPTGLVITRTYTDTSTEDLTYVGNEVDFSFSPSLTTALTTSNEKVTITYGGKSCDQAITVTDAPASILATLDFSEHAASGTTTTSLTDETLATLLNESSSVSNLVTSASILSGSVFSGKGQGGGSIPQRVLKCGTASAGVDFSFTIDGSVDVTKVVVNGHVWATNASISVNDDTDQTYGTAQEATPHAFEFTVAPASKTVRVTVENSAVCVSSIVLYKGGPTPSPIYTISYDANGGSGTMAQSQSLNPSVKNCTFTPPTGKVFERWNTQADGNGSTYEAGTRVTSNLTLYAIWKTALEFKQTELAAGKEIIIVGNNGAYFAMGVTDLVGSAPKAIASTVSGDRLKSTSDLSTQILVVEGDSSGWSFKVKGTSNYLYVLTSDNNNRVRVGSSTNKTFVISSGYLKNTAGSGFYLGVYNSDHWRGYTSNTSAAIKDQTFTFWEKA